jgi:hypothetical protein
MAPELSVSYGAQPKDDKGSARVNPDSYVVDDNPYRRIVSFLQ